MDSIKYAAIQQHLGTQCCYMVLYYYYYEKWSRKRIAEVFHKSPTTIGNIITRYEKDGQVGRGDRGALIHR